MIPFSQRQNCTKCDSPLILIPKYHKAWFSRDEWLEYICDCGNCFKTETADVSGTNHCLEQERSDFAFPCAHCRKHNKLTWEPSESMYRVSRMEYKSEPIDVVKVLVEAEDIEE